MDIMPWDVGVKFTPPPWVVEEGQIISRQENGDGFIGTVYGIEDFPCISNLEEDELEEADEEYIGNASIMSASPDLFMACILAEKTLAGAVTAHGQSCKCYSGGTCDCWLPMRIESLEKLRAALGKARNQQSFAESE